MGGKEEGGELSCCGGGGGDYEANQVLVKNGTCFTCTTYVVMYVFRSKTELVPVFKVPEP